jgi:Acetyltransferase (GNAT) family.
VGQATGTRLFVAEVGGQEAATGAVHLQDGVAALHGTATRPAFRGHGAQTALLAWRLRGAMHAGADLATVFVTPGSPSERNVERAGFRLVGMRLTFTKQP